MMTRAAAWEASACCCSSLHPTVPRHQFLPFWEPSEGRTRTERESGTRKRRLRQLFLRIPMLPWLRIQRKQQRRQTAVHAYRAGVGSGKSSSSSVPGAEGPTSKLRPVEGTWTKDCECGNVRSISCEMKARAKQRCVEEFTAQLHRFKSVRSLWSESASSSACRYAKRRSARSAAEPEPTKSFLTVATLPLPDAPIEQMPPENKRALSSG